MKWVENTRPYTLSHHRQPASEIISKYQRMVALQVGGHHDGIWDDCLRDFPTMFRTIRNHHNVTAIEFGRTAENWQPAPPKAQPRTMPWVVALPLLAWMVWTGEL